MTRSSEFLYPPSYYAASAKPAPDAMSLDGEIRCDVCIVGAGYTGLSTAIHLLERGLDVVVLEQARVGWGASGRNGGQIVNSYSRDIDAIERSAGQSVADVLGPLAFEGGRIIRDLVARYNIDCDLKQGGIFAALNAKQMAELEHQKALWERYGYDKLELLDSSAIGREVATERYVGGLLDHGSGHIHPLNLALGEAAAVRQLGGRIYEHSQVRSITPNPAGKGGAEVLTEHGRVQARTLVLAGNAYLGGLVPELSAKSMPCGTQVVATEPLSEEQARALIPKDYCVEDCNYLLDYYRLSADKRLLYGGGVVYGARDPADIERLIRPKLLKTFPQLEGVKIDYCWTGNFLMTLSRLPQVGTLGDNIFYSQGCSGHGVTYTHLAGRLLCEKILGESAGFDAFAALKHYPFPGGHRFQAPLSAMGAWYYSMKDRLGL
ncbi:NAD(P)/FAD-dependent oxidoreductase [Marinobacterium lutimaris]|uniref:Gamma-glutamylputrescine oxidase n=1 Tax=Marinobacterium lutimaris TaxID=568106 RepID=A0A1H5V4B5_9GAMM|nr:gamma-glutamylputrescine oxidase [Marinobacterium lutimaris]